MAHHKRSRTSTGRVKSGCTTCKIRHVKCDEGRPRCTRCITTGRACNDYENGLSLPRPVPSTLDANELRAFSHFFTHVAPIMSGSFDSNFWTDLIPRIASHEPAVRHAIVAFDTLYEKMTRLTFSRMDSAEATTDNRPDWRHDPYAVLQYNKAIKCLVDQPRSTSSIDVVMLVCILFVCIEALRGEIDTAIMHFNNCMKVHLEHAISTSRMGERVLPLLHRVELLSILFDNKPPWPYPLRLEDAAPRELCTIGAARDSLIHLMNLIMRFVNADGRSRYQDFVSSRDYEQQAALQGALQVWRAKHNDFVASTTPLSQQHVFAARMLRIHYLVAHIMLVRATEAAECTSDTMTAEFEMALAMAETVAKSSEQLPRHPNPKSGIFLLDMELVSPLYFIAVKCRHPIVRRRALAVLRTLRRREAFFDSDLAAALAERIVDIEEASLTAFDGSEFPPERDRIHHTNLNIVFGAGSPKCTSIFYSKPHGLTAPWQELRADLCIRR